MTKLLLTRIYLFTVIFVFIVSSCVLCQKKKIIDLTWHFDNNTIYWPGVQPFVFTKRVETDGKGFWYAENEFCAGEHGGTHIDAPYHFYRYGWKVGNIPVERLIAKGALLDLKKYRKNETENLDISHLEMWERDHGPIEQGTVLLIKFGYSEYWHNATKFHGLGPDKMHHFPGVSKRAAEWLANSGKFYGVGVDTASIDPGQVTDFAAHQILNAKQIYLLENVKLIEELPPKGFTLLVMPMKLREGSGAPLRIVAILAKSVD